MNWINSLQLKKITVVLHDTKQCYHTRSTRQSSQLNIPRCHRAVSQRSFSHRGVKLWSGISDNLNLPTQLTCLRSDLSNYLFSNKNRIRNSKFYFIHYFYFVIIIFMNYCYWPLFLTIFLPYCPVTEKPFKGVVIKVCVYVTVINWLIYSGASRSRARAEPIPKEIW